VAQGAIDLHVHAQPGTEDALDIAKSASLAKMGGVVFKNLPRHQPLWDEYQGVVDELSRWAETADVEPVTCFFGAQTDPQYGGLSVETVRAAIDHGARVVWCPVLTSAHSIHRVGAPRRALNGIDSAEEVVWPLPWEEARKYGQYLIGEDEATLKPEVRDILHLAADRGVAVSFAHSSKPEMQALAEECSRIGYRQAFIDHPYGPQVGLEFDDLAPFARAGIHFNFTYDEISPLLGVDPKAMMDAIRAIGPEHFTLSSDGGNPLLPGAVVALFTLIRYARAYGMTEDEITLMTATNPAEVLGLS
jgi:dihydroorotase-like cyclic amidohydrolase